MGTRTRALALASCVGSAGCFTADLDPGSDAVFACASDEDCPEPGRCVNALCQLLAPPSLQIQAPEIEHELDFVVGGGPIPIEVTIQGTLELSDPADGAEHVFGEGHVIVTIDGVEAATVVQGVLGGGVQSTLTIANEPGPHRIAVQARRNDGVRYDNVEAMATRLVWVDDGRPHVAIGSPWPLSVFPAESVEVEVSLATLNFTMAAPDAMITQGSGHAHVYYGFDLVECIDPNPLDDCPHLAIIAAENAPVTLSLPGGSEERGTLMAILRFGDHSPYTVPIGPKTLATVSDTIEVDRAE